MERELIRERVWDGRERATLKGKQLGRPRRAQPLTQHPLLPVVVSGLEAGHLTRTKAARKLRIRRTLLDQALRAVRNGGASELRSPEIEPQARQDGPKGNLSGPVGKIARWQTHG
jgi:DNA invertase Pin-like site-specific DNA recombinase